MLYLSGKIQKLGRVDKKDSYLDALGHVDFSTEMENAKLLSQHSRSIHQRSTNGR